MKLIRNNAFETNSSSCHSFTYAEGCPENVNLVERLGFHPLYIREDRLKEEHDKLPTIDGPKFKLGLGDYGWDRETYSDLAAHADYCYLQLFDSYNTVCDECRESHPDRM